MLLQIKAGSDDVDNVKCIMKRGLTLASQADIGYTISTDCVEVVVVAVKVAISAISAGRRSNHSLQIRVITTQTGYTGMEG